MLARILTLLAFLTCISSASAQTKRQSADMTVDVTDVQHGAHGFLVKVKIANTSKRVLFLPQSPGWPQFQYRPQVLSLNVEQWSDGKTNLLPLGRSLSSSLPHQPGYFSVGPCRDVPFEGHWIPVAPGTTLTDEIPVFDPSTADYIPSSCTWRSARLGPTVRVFVTAYTSKSMRNSHELIVWADTALPSN
jgi:hypothetical protein